jgi:pimeloyl-ACP methyl ester carboxylesterase
MTRHAVGTEGATLVYEKVGAGPLLIMIAGAGGLGSAYRRAADQLAEEYTVLTYDRRCRGASTGNRDQDLDLGQQARDAAAIIRDTGAMQAYVFGSSGGGCIAVKLTEERPQLVAGLIVHEPAIVSVLPDAERWRAHAAEVHDLYLRKGVLRAMARFAKPVKGVNPIKMIRARRGGERPDFAFFMAHEHVPISAYRPDIEALRQAAVPTVTLSGRASRDGYNARTAPALADLLGARFGTISGNHFPYLLDPDRFVAELRPHLTEISAHHG